MNKLLMQMLFCAFLLSAAGLNHLAAQGPTPLPPGTPSIEIFVTASGKSSSPASLSQTELTATLDKQPIPVTSVRSAKNDQLLFALLVDGSTSNARQSGSIRNAAYQLFQGLSTGNNQGYLVFFDTSARASRRPLQPSEVRKALDGLKFDGGTALFDAIAETCSTVMSKRQNPDTPRRVILLLSDGGDNQSRTYPQEAVQSAEKEGVSVFSLGTPTTEASGERVLSEIAKKTGGQAIINRNMEEGVKALLNAIDSQWVLSLVPPPSSDQKLHSFMVKSSQKGVQISAPAQIVLQ